MLPAKRAVRPEKTLPKESYRGYLPDYIIDKKKTGWAAPVLEWAGKSNSKLNNYLKVVLSPGYHTETDPLFQFNKIKGDKSTFSTFYFRIWAKEFNLST